MPPVGEMIEPMGSGRTTQAVALASLPRPLARRGRRTNPARPPPRAPKLPRPGRSALSPRLLSRRWHSPRPLPQPAPACPARACQVAPAKAAPAQAAPAKAAPGQVAPGQVAPGRVRSGRGRCPGSGCSARLLGPSPPPPPPPPPRPARRPGCSGPGPSGSERDWATCSASSHRSAASSARWQGTGHGPGHASQSASSVAKYQTSGRRGGPEADRAGGAQPLKNRCHGKPGRLNRIPGPVGWPDQIQ